MKFFAFNPFKPTARENVFAILKSIPTDRKSLKTFDDFFSFRSYPLPRVTPEFELGT